MFLLLEAIAVWLIVSNNGTQGALFFNSSNRIAGNIFETRSSIREYFSLNQVNSDLANQNAALLNKLEDYERLFVNTDSLRPELMLIDSMTLANYEFLSAKVINNSVRRAQNILTLNKGKNAGIETGMGVFNEQGIVGRVKDVSDKFSTVISILHTESLVSSVLQSSNVFGTTRWDGVNPDEASLLYVPRHVTVTVGDTVVTSGYNSVYPEGLKIGVVKSVERGTEATFYDIKINLLTNFSSLSYVYLVKNKNLPEIDSLQQVSGVINEQ